MSDLSTRLKTTGLTKADFAIANERRHWLAIDRILTAIADIPETLSARKTLALIKAFTGKTTHHYRLKEARQYTLTHVRNILRFLFSSGVHTAFLTGIEDVLKILRSTATRDFASLCSQLRKTAKTKQATSAAIERCKQRAKSENEKPRSQTKSTLDRAAESERSVKMSQSDMQSLFDHRRHKKNGQPGLWQETRQKLRRMIDYVSSRDEKTDKNRQQEFAPANAGAYQKWIRPSWMPARRIAT